MRIGRLCLVYAIALLCLLPSLHGQGRRPAPAIPRIDVQNYKIEVTLRPEENELTAMARITFRALEKIETAVFEISENLSVLKAADDNGVEMLFGQEEAGPGLLSLHLSRPLAADQTASVNIEYTGGFDRDRYSRNYTRDESLAYIGSDGTFLTYPSKWFPVHDPLVDRAAATIEVTVPLGMTAIAAGDQLPVVTKGITEKFGWVSKRPILPNSVVAGQYFERKAVAGDVQVSCFAAEEHIESMQQVAEAAAKIVDYYHDSFGAAASGKNLRLVEIDDRAAAHHGALGTVYIPTRELTPKAVSVRELARRIAFQWWMETVGINSREDLWLVDGLSYFSAALYLRQLNGPEAFREELANLAVLALKFESKSPIRSGYGLGYKLEAYESVVAGKGAWVLNMLRELIGDAQFSQLLQRYLTEVADQGGSTAAFQKLAESICGKGLQWFFAQWIDTTGVPTLQSDFVIYRLIDGFRVSGTVTQDRDLFRMPLDIQVTARDVEQIGTVMLDGKSTAFDIETPTYPEKVLLDPAGKILRDSPELQLAVQLTLGMDLKEKGNLVESIRAFESALKRNPRSSLAHFRMAEVFFDQFNLNAAADSFRNALNGDKQPAWIEVWCYIYLGKVFDILGQRQRAMAEYNKALNTKDDTNGAQGEAKKWLSTPYTKEAATMESKQPG